VLNVESGGFQIILKFPCNPVFTERIEKRCWLRWNYHRGCKRPWLTRVVDSY